MLKLFSGHVNPLLLVNMFHESQYENLGFQVIELVKFGDSTAHFLFGTAQVLSCA